VTYRVNVTARAERDLAFLFDEINARQSDAAQFAIKGFQYEILFVQLTLSAKGFTQDVRHSPAIECCYHGIRFSHIHAAVDVQRMAGDV
jgi:hypothetical protein